MCFSIVQVLIKSVLLLQESSIEKTLVLFFALESSQNNSSKDCYQCFVNLIIEVIFLPNYNLVFLNQSNNWSFSNLQEAGFLKQQFFCSLNWTSNILRKLKNLHFMTQIFSGKFLGNYKLIFLPQVCKKGIETLQECSIE